MFNISVNVKCTKKVDPILESLLDVQSFFDALHAIYQLSEIKDDIQVSISMFIGTPCMYFIYMIC